MIVSASCLGLLLGHLDIQQMLGHELFSSVMSVMARAIRFIMEDPNVSFKGADNVRLSAEYGIDNESRSLPQWRRR